MWSNDVVAALRAEERNLLLDVADASIAQALRGDGSPAPSGEWNDRPASLVRFPLSADDFPPPLRAPLATFVTLRIEGALRGCMGSLEAAEPLVENVARNAVAAAFHDPRFPALEECELERLDVRVSVLSPPEPIDFASEAELLTLVRPGIDGLILREGRRRGTLLPAVWEQVSEPREFVDHLKRKAGLATDYWSDTLQVLRYRAESIARGDRVP